MPGSRRMCSDAPVSAARSRQPCSAASRCWLRGSVGRVRRRLVDPAAVMAAIDTGGREVAEPSRADRAARGRCAAPDRRPRPARSCRGRASRRRTLRRRARSSHRTGEPRCPLRAGCVLSLRSVQVPATVQPCDLRKLGDFKAAEAQTEDEKSSCHLVRNAVGAVLFNHVVSSQDAVAAARPSSSRRRPSRSPFPSCPAPAQPLARAARA